MTNSELKQAQEWAKHVSALPHLNAETQSAINVIKSLPDHWVDAKSVQEIIDEMNRPWGIPRVTDFERGTDLATEAWKRRLEALLTPKLPTLADMTPEERLASKFMQAKIADSDQIYVISSPGLTSSSLWPENGHVIRRDNEHITPLPDLPKLEWPGSEPRPKRVSLSDMWVDDGSSPLDAMKLLADKYEELDRIKPEDVPADELWLVEYNERQWVGKRSRHWTGDYPWCVASVTGEGIDIANDSQVTLIHKLVPEPPALPEGMRLADHDTYGRVVVSPKMGGDDEYKVTHTDPKSSCGADWHYAHESKLTFLDGE